MAFEARPAVRRNMPITCALFGASSSGKTYTMLRMLAGMERVSKKPTFVIDTEGDRALHYADDFKFQHVPFEPPFTSERYVEAIEYCIAQGAGQIGVDSGSHEHEGEGGLLDRHWKTCLRMARGDERRAEAMSQPAWAEVKEAHNKLRICIQRTKVSQVWGFRAKEKTKVGKDPETKKQTITNIGFMPIGGTDLVFEFMLSAMLLPGSRGVPTWTSELRGEEVVIKVPKQFERLCAEHRGPLSEDFAEQLARWGAGKAVADRPITDLGMRFHKNWTNPTWAGAPMDSAPLEVVNEYINDLDARKSPLLPSVVAYFDERSAKELAP